MPEKVTGSPSNKYSTVIAAIVESAEWKRHRRTSERRQARNIAFDSRSIDDRRPQYGESHTALVNESLGLELGAAIDIDRARIVGFGDDAIGGESSLRTNRRDEHE